jgi:hypothetical protein
MKILLNGHSLTLSLQYGSRKLLFAFHLSYKHPIPLLLEQIINNRTD